MPGRVVDDERVERLELAGLELREQVGDRLVLRVEVQQDADVAELEGARRPATTFLPSSVAAATARLTATVVRPTPPFGLKTAMTVPGSPPPSLVGAPPPRAGRRDRRGGHAAGLVALAGMDLSDRGGQLVAAERLDEELARSGQHGPAQVVGLALDRHHHHGRGGSVAAICSVAAMPSMSGMLMSIRTMSGVSLPAISSASRPDAAAPTTSMSLSKPSSFVR